MLSQKTCHKNDKTLKSRQLNTVLLQNVLIVAIVHISGSFEFTDFIWFSPSPLPLPVNGGFSNWEDWGPCSSTCGQGFQERIRLCNNPKPANGGRSCSGASVDSRKCQAGLCPGDFNCLTPCLWTGTQCAPFSHFTLFSSLQWCLIFVRLNICIHKKIFMPLAMYLKGISLKTFSISSFYLHTEFISYWST